MGRRYNDTPEATPYRLSSQCPSLSARQPTREHHSAVETSTHRRRLNRWSPWHVSSFSDSAIGDSPLGEDPVVRAAALEALGNWNGSVVVVDPNTGRILSIVNPEARVLRRFHPLLYIQAGRCPGRVKEGIVSPETKLRVWGRGGPRLNLTDALAHSNNMYFAKLGEMLGFRRVSAYAREFGLGERAGWNIWRVSRIFPARASQGRRGRPAHQLRPGH